MRTLLAVQQHRYAEMMDGGQAVVAGRYHDRFRKIDNRWQFAERDYTLMDLIGDVSQHLRS